MRHFPHITRACALAVGLLLTAELVARIGFQSSADGRFEYGYHPTAGFREEKGGILRLMRTGGRRFFEQRFPLAKPEKTHRIMVLGDSVPRGRSVENSYAGQLRVLLEDQGIRAEVWNLAVPGYGAKRVQVVLRQALRYNPSLVILHLNNSNEFEDDRERQRSLEFTGLHPKNWLMKSFLLRRLYEARTEQLSWKLLPEVVRAREGARDADTETLAGMNSEKLREWEKRIRDTVREDLELCRAQNVPVILVSQAQRMLTQDGHYAVNDAGLGTFADSITNSQVLHIPMAGVLQPLDPAVVFADTSHLREPGHAAMAKAIQQAMEKARPLNSPDGLKR